MDIAVLGVYAALFIALYFEVFLLLSFLERKPYKKTFLTPKHYPSITMIVPCFNESQTLVQTVDSLLALEYPKEKIGIVIVDDGSTDNTCDIGKALAAQHPQVTFFHKVNGGKYTALNLGIEHAKTELVGCLDADSFVAPDAMLEVAKRLESDTTIMALTPSMQVYRPRRALELMQAVEYTFGVFYKKMFDNLAALNVLPGPFSIYKREVFANIGLFRHAHNTEDMEIAFRMHAHGLKIVNAHTAYVHTIVPSTLRKLIKQRTRWSQGFLQNSRDYSYMYFNRRFGNFGMLVLPFGLVSFFAGLYMAGYVFFTFAYSITTRIADRWATGIPLHLTAPSLDWFYINTGMMLFLILFIIGMTLVGILLGHRITKTQVGLKSLFFYFALFGLVAPLWLARAVWGALRAQESVWR
ncbi:MAG: glycosyltransferase family 2 protein [bacterium]|nr:glycosyltransferase family 2 protein [bacterium]